MTTAEKLRAAAARIREVGLAKGAACTDDGRECALKAIGVVTGDDWMPTGMVLQQHPDVADAILAAVRPVPTATNARIADELPELPHLRAWAAIVSWNDADDQTAENVAAGLEYAALWAEERELLRHVAEAVTR